ncbi:MAG: Dabb family protein [Chitinophagaceae bacterium]|nr:Dabb family protein [Chitinophagaceae bacterium]
MSETNRRTFLTTTAALCAGTVAASTPLPAAGKKYPIVHHVFFWLKNAGSETDRKKLIEGVRTLKAIEQIGELHIGVVASTEKRDVVDTSWDVSELIFFRDLAAQAAYQNHPIHLAFVRNYGHLWSKVIVYDAMEA